MDTILLAPRDAPAGSGGFAEELERLAGLLEKVAINEGEYAALKAKVIAG